MEEGNVTNNFRELFPDTKEGCKIDYEHGIIILTGITCNKIPL